MVGLSAPPEEKGVSEDTRGLKITATLQGRREGRSVTWLKLCDGVWRNYDSVHYAGDVSDGGNEIHGRWTIPENRSGTFLMIRASGAGAALSLETAERV